MDNFEDVLNQFTGITDDYIKINEALYISSAKRKNQSNQILNKCVKEILINSNLWSNNKRKNKCLPLRRCCGYHKRKLKNQSKKRILIKRVQTFTDNLEKLIDGTLTVQPYMIYEEMIEHKDTKGKG